MKTLAYLDCPTGIAGDMCLGALVHAGVPLSYLIDNLARLGIDDEFQLRAESVLRNQQQATKVHVDLLRHKHDHSHEHHHHHGSRRLPEIETLIQQAQLPERVTRWSLDIFRRLAEAEASVHGIAPEQVHFHEVGATDAIVDIVGSCLGLDWLKVDRLMCSPLPTGGGTVRCEHGLLPVPVPAVLAMMTRSQVPVYSNGMERELVTPTGCAIATTLAESFGPPPRFTLQKMGLGAGGRNLSLPNILRLWIGTVDEGAITPAHHLAHHSAHHLTDSQQTDSQQTDSQQTDLQPPDVKTADTPETIVELQTQLDDCSPQAIGYLFDALLAAGAVDIFTQPIAMKKSRLGTLITVLCPPEVASTCEKLLFCETTTLGIRRTLQNRTVLDREMIRVQTTYGHIPVKVARAAGTQTVMNIQPEYEDCARVARVQKVPWKQVHQAAMAAADRQLIVDD